MNTNSTNIPAAPGNEKKKQEIYTSSASVGNPHIRSVATVKRGTLKGIIQMNYQ